MTTAGVIMNLGIMALAAFAFWITKSGWSFLILLFLFSVRYTPDKIKTKCPKCEHEFTAVEKEEDEEED